MKEWKEWGIECLKSFGKGIWWCISTPFISGWNFFRWICEGIWNKVWTIIDNMFYDSALDKYRLTGRQVVFFCLGFVLLWCVYLLILAIVWFTRWRDGTLGNHDGGEAQDDGAQRRSRWGFRWWWKRRERKDDGADQDDGTAGGGGRNDPIHVPDNDSDSEDAEEDLQPTPQSERDLPKIDDKRGVPSRTMLKPRPGDSSLVLVRPPITKDMLCRDDIDNFYNDGVRDNLFPTYTQATSGTFGPEGMEDARAGALHANKVRQKFLNEWTTTTPQTPVTAYWLIHKHFNTTAVRASNFGNQPKLQANLGSRFNLHHQALHSILGTSEPVVENLKSTLGPYWKHARSYHFCIGEARNTNIQNKDRLRKKKRQKLADGRYKWV